MDDILIAFILYVYFDENIFVLLMYLVTILKIFMKSKCFIIIYYQLLFAIGIQYNYHIEIKSLFNRAESAIPTQNLHEQWIYRKEQDRSCMDYNLIQDFEL